MTQLNPGMIRKPCDGCERMLEFRPEQAGSKVRCPHCGDVNLVPGSEDRAGAAGLPPDYGPEQEVMVLRPSMVRAHPFLTIFTLGIGAIVLWFRHLGDRIHITNKRTIMRQGLFSKSTTEVLHDHVRNIQISQSFLNRIFDVGDIGISSSGQEGIEIQAFAIPHPNEVKKTIDHYRPM